MLISNVFTFLFVFAFIVGLEYLAISFVFNILDLYTNIVDSSLEEEVFMRSYIMDCQLRDPAVQEMVEARMAA